MSFSDVKQHVFRFLHALTYFYVQFVRRHQVKVFVCCVHGLSCIEYVPKYLSHTSSIFTVQYWTTGTNVEKIFYKIKPVIEFEILPLLLFLFFLIPFLQNTQSSK